MAELRTHVHVHLEDGSVAVYGPGDEVPADHAKLITNPKVWADENEDDDKPRGRARKS